MWVKFPRYTLAASIKRWKTKSFTLNLEWGNQMRWRLVKPLNDEDNYRVETTLEDNGDMLTYK